MAKIPDSTVLGDRPTPRLGTGAPSPQLTSGVGSEMAAAGQRHGRAIQGVGDAITQVNDELVKARRGAQLTDALGKATMEIGELELSFKNDQDFRTSPERFAKQSAQVRARLEKGIDDKLVRQAFSREFMKMNTAKHLNVLQSAAAQEADYHASALDATLDVYAHSAANATNLAERELALNQARLSITGTQSGGWISNVDAGKKERAFLTKVDGAVALRDMAVAPALTANKLATDHSYLPNLDVVHRERLITSGYKQAEAGLNRERAEAEREERDAREATLSEAYKLMKDGDLDLVYVESIRNLVAPKDYLALRDALDAPKTETVKDDNVAFASVQSALLSDPDGAVALAFRLHREGKLSNATLSQTRTDAHSLTRQGGPRTPYERSRAFLTSSLEPSTYTMDPAPRARQGIALKEFDDWFADARERKTQLSPEDVEKKASAIITKYAMVDMNKLAAKTGIGSRDDPAVVLDDLREKAQLLASQHESGTITPQEFNRRMAELNRLRKAAENAKGAKK